MTTTLRMNKLKASGLGVLCLLMQGLATWAAFQGPDLLTNLVSWVWLVCLIAFFVVLGRQEEDRVFRLAAFLIGTSYVLFLAYKVWEFFTYAD